MFLFFFFPYAEKMYLNKEICLIPYCALEYPYYFCQLIPQNDEYQIENFHKSKFNLAKQSENVK